MTLARLPEADAPFVLLDDAGTDGGGQAMLFRDPVGVIRADRLDEVLPALARLEAAGAQGLHAAGYLSYTAGHAFERRSAGYAVRAGDAGPLLWFGLFEQPRSLSADAVAGLLPASDVAIGPIEPMISRADYGQAIGAVLDYIQAGDIYQANLTFPAQVAIAGDPLAAYGAIRPHAAAGHGALLRHDGRHILSFSPERFFALDEGGRIETRPMKGTARRSADPAEDTAAAADLARDPKQRAENLMIVDLLRNDLSRVAQPGSVAVPALFHVESYPTVHQMISVVEGQLREGLGPVDVLRALFPCGSITGAPKVRAMEIIREVERFGRGLYTGSIGHIAPSGAARFNVAIRTIVLEDGARSGTLGLGSGIVADSRPDAEWQECLDKARFLALAGERRS